MAACEVLACLRTQPVPAQPWSPALRAPTKSVASELLACKGAGEDAFRCIHEAVSAHPVAVLWLQPEQGWWQEGTVPTLTPGWGTVACSKASLCASALSPSPSLLSLPLSHSLAPLAQGSDAGWWVWMQRIVSGLQQKQGNYLGNPSWGESWPSKLIDRACLLPHTELCFPLPQRRGIQHLESGSDGTRDVFDVQLFSHKAFVSEHSWTQTVGDCVPGLYLHPGSQLSFPARTCPAQLPCPHSLDSLAPLAQGNDAGWWVWMERIVSGWIRGFSTSWMRWD